MDRCAYCATPTRLHHGFTPVCPACSDLIEAGQLLPSKIQPEREIGKIESTQTNGTKLSETHSA